MGQIEDRCNCFKKDDKNTFNFDEHSYSNPPTATNQNSTDANAFLAKNKQSPIESMKESRFSEFDVSRYNIAQVRKIRFIQAFVKGRNFRSAFKNTKQMMINQLNERLEKALNDYRSSILLKAEANKAGNYDSRGWINYYPDEASKFVFNYGRVFYTKLLFTSEGVYTGNVNMNGKKHGQGILLTNKSEKYEGFWLNHRFTCWGKFIDNEGNIFIGMSYIKI